MVMLTVLRRSLPVHKRFYGVVSVSREVSAAMEQHMYDEVKSIEYKRDNLDIVKQCRANPLLHEKTGYGHVIKCTRADSLTVGSLSGPGMIATPPILFYSKSMKQLLTVMHLGKKLCGHEGFIHGGLAAIILDEALGGVVFPVFLNKLTVTANLNINYKKPIFPNQWVVVRSKLDSIKDRKAFASATVESLDGQILAEATSLFISLKMNKV